MSAATLLPLGPTAGAPTRVPEMGSLSIGRERDSDLALLDPTTSREHAVLESVGEGWMIRDVGSGNGTFVNGRRITSRTLRGGEVLRFGPHLQYRFLVERDVAPWKRVLRSFVQPGIVARDPALGAKRVAIGAHPALVGRSPKADVVIPLPQVSDIHARLETRDGRLIVVDQKSRNGTHVNGETIRERAVDPDDEIAFGDVAFDVVTTWHPSSRGIVLGGGIVALVALAIVGQALMKPQVALTESLWTRAMYLEQAEQSLVDALSAYDRRGADVARAQFDIAIRSLIAADRLRPDRQSNPEVAAAFEEVGKRLSDDLAGRDLFRIYQSLIATEQRRDEPPPPAVAVGTIVEQELAMILAEFGIDVATQPIPPALLAEVEHFVEFWTNDMRGYTVRARQRAAPHLGSIRREFRANHLPEVFAYLPFVESGYRETIASPAGAMGLWQFMPATGRKYGLQVTDTIDDRTDPVLATRAACRYINDLLTTFGANAFMCAVAAYNKGEYGMVTCLRGVSWKSKWKFWDMVEKNDGCLKKETIEYVPKFLAAAIVMRRADHYGFGEDAPE